MCDEWDAIIGVLRIFDKIRIYFNRLGMRSTSVTFLIEPIAQFKCRSTKSDDLVKITFL